MNREKSIAVEEDRRLRHASLYWVSKGGMVDLEDPLDPDLVLTYRNFKARVVCGYDTVGSIEKWVYATYGTSRKALPPLEFSDIDFPPGQG